MARKIQKMFGGGMAPAGTPQRPMPARAARGPQGAVAMPVMGTPAGGQTPVSPMLSSSRGQTPVSPMLGYAKGGKIDGAAKRGKTRGKIV